MTRESCLLRLHSIHLNHIEKKCGRSVAEREKRAQIHDKPIDDIDRLSEKAKAPDIRFSAAFHTSTILAADYHKCSSHRTAWCYNLKIASFSKFFFGYFMMKKVQKIFVRNWSG